MWSFFLNVFAWLLLSDYNAVQEIQIHGFVEFGLVEFLDEIQDFALELDWSIDRALNGEQQARNASDVSLAGAYVVSQLLFVSEGIKHIFFQNSF